MKNKNMKILTEQDLLKLYLVVSASTGRTIIIKEELEKYLYILFNNNNKYDRFYKDIIFGLDIKDERLNLFNAFNYHVNYGLLTQMFKKGERNSGYSSYIINLTEAQAKTEIKHYDDDMVNQMREMQKLIQTKRITNLTKNGFNMSKFLSKYDETKNSQIKYVDPNLGIELEKLFPELIKK